MIMKFSVCFLTVLLYSTDCSGCISGRIFAIFWTLIRVILFCFIIIIWCYGKQSTELQTAQTWSTFARLRSLLSQLVFSNLSFWVFLFWFALDLYYLVNSYEFETVVLFLVVIDMMIYVQREKVESLGTLE